MKDFLKDIVMVDFEVTGFEIEKDEPVQIGILVLDKHSLKEKDRFVSWIRPVQEINPELPGFKWAALGEKEIGEINKAPSLEEVAKEAAKILPEKYTFCAWNASFDFYFWHRMLKTINLKTQTVAILDLWSLAYPILLNDENYKDDFKSERVFQYFGAKPRAKHDGLEDCKIEAMVLKKLLDKIRK